MEKSQYECLNSWKAFIQFSHFIRHQEFYWAFFGKDQLKLFLNFGIYNFLIECELRLHCWVLWSLEVKSTRRHKCLGKQTLFVLVLTDIFIFILFYSDSWICICKVFEELSKPNRDPEILSHMELPIFTFQLDLNKFHSVIKILWQNTVSGSWHYWHLRWNQQ